MKVLSFISCEDVRKEVDGKATLVGAFDGLTIDASKVTVSPIAIRIAAHLRVQFEPDDPVPDENALTIRVNETEIASGVSTMTIGTLRRPVTLVAPMMLVPIDAACDIIFEYAFRKDGLQIGDAHIFKVPVDVTGQLPAPLQ